MKDYATFIESKHVAAEPMGFDCTATDVNPKLFGWQRDIVAWAVRTGRAAIFAECGLGKTPMQLEWARIVYQHTRKPILILTPLAVAPQTLAEAAKFNIDAPIRIVRDGSEIGDGINVTNYESLHKFDGIDFGGVVLDESSILKAFMGKMRTQLIQRFASTPYRLACTATPAPNDHMELGNHSEFLGVMKIFEMTARWFINDYNQAAKFTLKKHGEQDFWKWVSSWAVSIAKPSDLGASDEGYDLPPLNVETITVPVPVEVFVGDALFASGDMSATTMHAEKRRSTDVRADRIAEIVNGSSEAWAVWCDSNYEADALMARIPDAVEVRGDMKDDERARNMAAFTNGTARVIVTKPEIAGFGLNWQHCHNAAFIGLSFSFERFYQAVRRHWRFGQVSPVRCVIVQSDGEAAISKVINAKSVQHEMMKSNMNAAMKECQLMNIYGSSKPLARFTPIKHEGDGWTLYHGDCVDVVSSLPSDSLGLSVYSPPFSNLYTYNSSMADMGNSADDEEFMQHYRYLVREKYRATIPGRLTVVHCKDLPKFKYKDGAAGISDFSGGIIKLHEEEGWHYHSRVTIWKNPVTEMQRTKSHGLLHKVLCKDSTNSRQAMPDYLLIFRKMLKDGEEATPVCGPSELVRFDRYVGTDKPGGDARGYSINVWQRYASPVWFDIDQSNTLNYRQAKGEDDVKHICPLQLDVIERAVELWSNPGDLVLSPFTGIGSEGYVSLLAGRKFVGAELKEEYVGEAIKHLGQAVAKRDSAQSGLFADVKP